MMVRQVLAVAVAALLWQSCEPVSRLAPAATPSAPAAVVAPVIPGWSVTVIEGRPAGCISGTWCTVARTDPEARTVTLWTQPEHPQGWAWLVAHERGHTLDIDRMTYLEREAWAAQAGIDWTRDISTGSWWAKGSEAFADCYADWSTGRSSRCPIGLLLKMVS